MFLLDCNRYNVLNSREGHDISLQNNLREVNKVIEVQIPPSSKQDKEVLMIKAINATVSPTSHHKLEAMSIGQAKGNQLGDHGKQIIQSLPRPVS